MRCPEFADDLFRRDPLALGNLLAACADRGLETCPILGIELVAIAILRYELEANLGAFREIDDILDNNATALNATVQQRHACEDTTTARGKHGLGLAKPSPRIDSLTTRVRAGSKTSRLSSGDEPGFRQNDVASSKDVESEPFTSPTI